MSMPECAWRSRSESHGEGGSPPEGRAGRLATRVVADLGAEGDEPDRQERPQRRRVAGGDLGEEHEAAGDRRADAELLAELLALLPV